MFGKLKLPHQPRLELLSAIARCADPPCCALLGLGSGHALLALGAGVRRIGERRLVTATKKLLCFHAGRGLEYIKQLVQRADRLHPAASPLGSVVHFIPSEGERSGWRAAIEERVGLGCEPFGVICHAGTGKAQDIRADLAVLMPLLDDRTLILLCGLAKRGPLEQFNRMVREKEWEGVQLDGLGVLQRARFAKGTR